MYVAAEVSGVTERRPHTSKAGRRTTTQRQHKASIAPGASQHQGGGAFRSNISHRVMLCRAFPRVHAACLCAAAVLHDRVDLAFGLTRCSNKRRRIVDFFLVLAVQARGCRRAQTRVQAAIADLTPAAVRCLTCFPGAASIACSLRSCKTR